MGFQCRDELCGRNHTREGIGQEGTAEALALKAGIDREADQQDRGHLGRATTTNDLWQVVASQASTVGSPESRESS